MKAINKLLFEDFDNAHYLKSNEAAKKDFKIITQFPNALGFDEESGGFVILHRQHAASGLEKELTACMRLRTEGYAVELLNENLGENIFAPDACISGEVYEIKNVANATNLGRAIDKQFRFAYKKASKILLHIEQEATDSDIADALRRAAINRPTIKNIILLRGNEKSVLLTRIEMVSKSWFKM